jgi:hypothetical protein
MAKFLFLYRNDHEKYYDLSPEEMQQIYQKWQAWMAEAVRQGCLVDAGHGLTKKGCVVNAEKVVSDGPFIEAKDIVGGYSIVQAETIAAAAEIAKGCPILLRGGSVEVRPLWV